MFDEICSTLARRLISVGSKDVLLTVCGISDRTRRGLSFWVPFVEALYFSSLEQLVHGFFGCLCFYSAAFTLSRGSYIWNVPRLDILKIFHSLALSSRCYLFGVLRWSPGREVASLISYSLVQEACFPNREDVSKARSFNATLYLCPCYMHTLKSGDAFIEVMSSS